MRENQHKVEMKDGTVIFTSFLNYLPKTTCLLGLLRMFYSSIHLHSKETDEVILDDIHISTND